MKKLFVVVALACAIAMPSYAQDYKELMKERKAMSKMAESELNSKVDKTVKKEAKALAKEGWKAAPGALPIEKQLERSYKMQYEIDDYGFPRYIKGDAQSLGGNYDAAKMSALNLAKINLAGNIQTEVVALVENAVGNNQLSHEEAVSTTETAMGAVNLVAQNLGRVITVVEVYRDVNKKNKEVRVLIFYNAEMAKQAAEAAMREDLKKKGSDLVEKVNGLLGLNKR